jgi:hypothetical protein
MGSGGHDSHLLTDNKSSACEGDENLAHDNEADIDVWLAEVDHEANAENCDGDTEVEGEPLEAAGVTD